MEDSAWSCNCPVALGNQLPFCCQGKNQVVLHIYLCLISIVLVTLDLDYGTELVSKDFCAGLGFFLSFSVSCLGGTLHSDITCIGFGFLHKF